MLCKNYYKRRSQLQRHLLAAIENKQLEVPIELIIQIKRHSR